MNWGRIPQAGACLTIGLQILWPLANGPDRATLTVLTVVLFAATSVSHAWIHRGWRWAAQYFVTTVVFAFAIEAIGVNTGFPFGAYEYGETLGFRILGVPPVIPLAWVMTAYPALLLARRLAKNPLLVAVVGAVALTSWDLFLDPQMVSENYWTWAHVDTALPGAPGVPVANYLGWFAGSLILMALLSLLPATQAPEGVPAALWTWTWIGGVIANAFFFDRIAVALSGGIVMGLVTVPYLWRLTRENRLA